MGRKSGKLGKGRKSSSKGRKSSTKGRENIKTTQKGKKDKNVVTSPKSKDKKTPVTSDTTVAKEEQVESLTNSLDQEVSEMFTMPGKECRMPTANAEVIQAIKVDFSESASKKAKDNVKPAMKAGKERATSYDHAKDLADPWMGKSEEKPEDYRLMLELLGIKEEKISKRWPRKQGRATLEMEDLLQEMPNYLKHLGVLQLFKRIIMNLYTMNPRPKNPCLEIFHLLDMWFGASDKSKVVETLEREYHSNLTRELRIIQEIGKLKTLCHFLLPVEYGPGGEVLASPPQLSDEDLYVVYGEDSDTDTEKGQKSEEDKGKKNKKKKDKEKKEKKSRRGSSLRTIGSKHSNTKSKKKKK